MIVIISIILFNIIHRNSDKLVEIKQYSFSEIRLVDISTDENSMNTVLKSMYVEDNDYCGFVSNEKKTVDLYEANAIVSMASIIPEYDINLIKEKLDFLSSINIENFDLLNLLYYVNICNSLDITIDYLQINKALDKYYDSNVNLFFIDDANDSINIKIVVTAFVKKIIGDNISTKYSLTEGIKKAYLEYDFVTESTTTLYNSGGDILYCLSQFELVDLIDKSSLNEWYKYWSSIYDQMTIETLDEALVYAEYIKVANIFDESNLPKKLQDFYCKITYEDIVTIDDFYILYNIFNNNVVMDNKAINTSIVKNIENVINSESFVSVDLDIKSTVYGYILAENSNFKIDKEKIRNYINKIKERESSEESSFEKAYNLYYNLILEQLVNNYNIDYDKSYYQNEINNNLKAITYSDETIVADIITTRRLIEIASDLNIFDVKISLTESQLKEIKLGINKALKNELLKNSVLINDIFVISEILSLNMVTSSDLYDVYNLLTENGGTKATTEEENIPDILSTYQFYSSFFMINDYSNLDSQKVFINTLKLDGGIYYNNIYSNEIDLAVNVYGIAISGFEYGGDKNDSNL